MQVIRLRRLLVVTLLLFCLTDIVAAQCIPIARRRGGDHLQAPAYDDFEITKSGRYCLTEDITMGRKFVLSEGGEISYNAPIGYIEASHSEIDLKGHALTAKAIGSWVLDAGNTSDEIRVAHLTVHNGTLRSRSNCGFLAAHLLGPYFGSIRSDFTLTFGADKDKSRNDRAVLHDRVTAPLSKLRNNFPTTGHHLLKLTVNVGGWGVKPRSRAWQNAIAIQGAGNNIRDSIVTTYDAHAGIYLFGPNQVIENNTIIFKGSPSAPSGAPIKLHAADNSVIRNNTIVIEGWFGKPEAAISLIDSRNVLIENNRVIGIKQLYKIWDESPEQQSSVITHGNRFPTLWERILGQ